MFSMLISRNIHKNSYRNQRITSIDLNSMDELIENLCTISFRHLEKVQSPFQDEVMKIT